MNENMEKIRFFCEKIKYTGNKSDEFLFTANCVDYFYFSKNIGEVDIKDGLVDGTGDGGIDFIFIDSEKVYLIQGKSSENISYNEIRDVYYKILDTYNNLINKNYFNYSERLKYSFISAIESFVSEPDVELVLFTNTLLTEDMKNRFVELSSRSEFVNFTLSLYGMDEIESKVLSIEQGNMSIKEGHLILDRAKNFLEYQEGRGAIFSIKASSLKELFLRYSTSGLFGYNLREHISEKKVDNAIDHTIKNDPESFWFLNNGITIGCSEYDISGNKLKLYNFSIINGAQTTHKVGNSKLINEEYDFCIVCKVITSEKSLEDSFIRNISEASNSQKPIRPRDLRANSYEQQLFQNKAANNGKYSLAVDIKRGVKPSNVRGLQYRWQRVTNEYVGQLIWACDYQCPGSARSKKSDVFGKEKIYNSLFGIDKVKKYDYDTIFDLVRLANYYDEFKITYGIRAEREINESINEAEKRKISERNIICQNAKFTTLALVLYFYKRRYMKLSNNDAKLFQLNLKGRLSLDYDEKDYMSKLHYLFEFIIVKLTDIYNTNQVILNLTSQSNFLKLDTYYTDVIIPAFNRIYEDKYDQEKIIDNLKIFEKRSDV